MGSTLFSADRRTGRHRLCEPWSGQFDDDGFGHGPLLVDDVVNPVRFSLTLTYSDMYVTSLEVRRSGPVRVFRHHHLT
jgi:hypothetical protein